MRALVTGGAGGLGSAVAAELVLAGAKVVLLDRRTPPPERLPSPAVTAVEVDLADDGAAEEAVAAAVTQLGGLDWVVRAAGIYEDGSDSRVSTFRHLVDVNLVSAFTVLMAAHPHLARSSQPAVVTIASVSGRTKSIVAGPAYVASKAGLIGLSMSFAARWAAGGIRVNCVAPGATDTDMTSGYTIAQRSAIVSQVPLGRFARPDEVASVVRFLLSEDASYITGHTLDVNGGLFMS